MKQSDPLQFVEAGSLARPGPIGRALRLALGIACWYAVFQLIVYRQAIIADPVTLLPNLSIIVLAAICIINYVVNIGFGVSWGRWPSYVSLAAGVVLAITAWLLFGSANHPSFGVALWAWLLYFYVHLGSSFVLAAIVATPGCEMRAIPELIGRLSNRSAQEHHCPAALISKVDAWERRLSSDTR